MNYWTLIIIFAISLSIINYLKLRKSKEQYKKLIKHLPLGIAVHEGDKITYANDALLKILEANSISDVIGQSIWSFIPKPIIDEVQSRLNSAFRGVEKGEFIEQRIYKVDKTPIDLEIGGLLLSLKKAPEILVVVRDITERKKAEKLKKNIEYEKMKTEFFSNLSHELKTPLNLIFSTAQLMDLADRDGEYISNKDKRSRHNRILKQNCYRLLRLVNNLIDITKADSGYLHLNLEEYDISQLVSNIVFSIEDYTKNKDIELFFENSVNNKIIACDADKIERILLNLLSNAIKFTNKGGKISVNITEMNDNIQISVKDTGIGIPKEKQIDIFNRFIQVDKSFKRNHEGSGIGLSIVKSMVAMHNGKILLNSEVGVGSEFIVILPTNLEAEKAVTMEQKLEKDLVEKINIEFSDIYS